MIAVTYAPVPTNNPQTSRAGSAAASATIRSVNSLDIATVIVTSLEHDNKRFHDFGNDS